MTSATNYGFVSVFTPPSLNLVYQQSLIQFETEYTAFRAKLGDMNKDLNDANKMQVESIKNCLEPTTLLSRTDHPKRFMCKGKIDGSDSVEDASAASVKSWFDATSTVAPNYLSERIDPALFTVSYEVNKNDISGGGQISS